MHRNHIFRRILPANKDVILIELTIFGRHLTEYKALVLPFFAGCPVTAVPCRDDGILLSGSSAVHPTVLATSGQNNDLARQFTDACIVTCGMSARDSVSCSSVADNGAVVSIVRELPIVGGGFVEVQDVCLPLSRPLPAGKIALFVAACLCAGIPASRLAQKPR